MYGGFKNKALPNPALDGDKPKKAQTEGESHQEMEKTDESKDNKSKPSGPK